MKQKLQLSGEARVQAAAGDKLPTFDLVAYTGAALRQYWSETPIVVDLSGVQIAATGPVLKGHTTSQGVGHWTANQNDGKQLSISGVFSRDTEDAREVVTSGARGYPWKVSIGADILERREVNEGQATVNGRVFDAPVIIVARSNVYEVSFVELAADEATSAKIAAERQKETQTMTEEEKKIEAKRVADEAAAKIEAKRLADEATAKAEKDETDRRVKAQRDTDAREVERVAAIRAVAGITAERAAKAIRDGEQADKVELEVLRASRPAGFSVHIGQRPDLTPDVMAAAVCATGGVTTGFKPEIVEAAQKGFGKSLSLQQLIVECARLNGYSGSPYLRTAGDIREAIRAAFSTSTLASVLSTAANRFLMEAFNAVDSVWREIASINASVQDFREYETYAWTGDLAFEKLAPAGKIKHGVADDTKYTNQVDTYARMLQVSRKDIINDDIGVIQSGMRKLGRGGALALNTAFWAEFLSNTGDFFGTANANLKTGAGSAFGETGLTGALQAFREMTGPDSQYVMARIKTLLVPPALEVSAKNWMNSTTVVGGTSKAPGNNPFAGLATVQTSPYLKANSTKWWLIADPADVPVIEVGFLRGAQNPTVEEVDADSDELGIAMRGYFDFGVKKQVPQAAVQSNGV